MSRMAILACFGAAFIPSVALAQATAPGAKGAAAAAAAQDGSAEMTTATFGDWQLRCRNPAAATGGQPAAQRSCEVVQSVVIQGQSAPFAQLAFGKAPPACEGTAEWYRQLWRCSRNFALVADVTVATLGGGLKVKQKLTGRLADALSELYFVACALKRYEDDGRPQSDLKIVAMVAQNGLHRFEEALLGTVDNFPVAPVRWVLRWLVFPFGRVFRPASDRLGHEVVRLVTVPGEVRDRLTRHIYVSTDVNDPTGLLEVTLAKVVAAEEAEKKLERAVRAGTVLRFHGNDWIGDAAAKGVLTAEEAKLLAEVEALTAKVIAVDHFDPAEVKPHYMSLGHNSREARDIAAE